ncbi:MAG: prephenate dehydrogenase/arogenate dehydrogenase family protein [Gammaproteobacteria bacterium]|nr:prephenate dehydrogenase/arogenate dehydrogenase family protein [Gammaproteobacteria bacterium]
MTDVLISRLCIIGVGLIGGSLARALRHANVVNEVIGCGRDIAHLQKAQQLGVIDHYVTDPAEAVKDADMVVLAVPLGAMQGIMERIAPVLTPECILTDVGSAKGSVITAAQNVFGDIPPFLIPGHPIAGTEKSGVDASFAELFQKRRVILTPTETSAADAVHKVRVMWEACGADVVEMGVAHHDEILAATSHLPHMLAYALVDTLARMDDSREIFDFAAGGFRDFTRIASSDPDMWHDICLANHDALVKMLEAFSDDLRLLADAVRRADSDFLKDTFTRAKKARDAFCDNGN